MNVLIYRENIHLLTNTSSRYIVWIKGPTVFANAISLVTVSLTEGMFAASYLITRCFEIT